MGSVFRKSELLTGVDERLTGYSPRNHSKHRQRADDQQHRRDAVQERIGYEEQAREGQHGHGVENANTPHRTIPTMPLTQQQFDQFDAWMNDHFPDGLPCPLCGRTVWASGEIVTGLPVDLEGKQVLQGGRTAPMLQVTCQSCRYIALFEAGPMGLIGVRPPRNE